MGLFNKTEEELKKEEESKKYKAIINEINRAYEDNSISYSVKVVLSDYVESIRNGKPNDFKDIETLYRVIAKLLENTHFNVNETKEHLQDIINLYRKMILEEQNEEISNYFINNFVGPDGVIANELLDDGFYALFKEKEDYFEIMSMILSADMDQVDFDRITEYAKTVCKYCLTQDVLKRDLISYIKGLSEIVDDDYDKYDKEQLEQARKRVGIYNISPKELARVDSKLSKMENYLEQLEIYTSSIQEEKKAVTALVEEGRKEIKQETKTSIDTLKQMIEQQKQLLMEKLDAYLLDLEEILQTKSDDTFKQIISTYQGQVQEFRSLFLGYSKAASKDFLEIQKATEESVKRLQNYVSTEPQLQELLVKAQEQGVIREKIVELVTKEKELEQKAKVVSKDTPQVIIPGYDQRIMVPYRHMILPTEIPSKILPAFNESIPFDTRMRTIEKRMRQKESQGEIFHKKIMQIVIDLMEGDWPYMWGPSGTGKSYMAKQVASLLGIPLTKAGKITEPYSVLGYNDPQGRYQITPSFISVLYGNLLFLDELDNGNPDTQVVLNDIYSELLNKLDDPEEVCEVTFGTDINVDIHPNFRLLGAGNTSGEGENEAFSSRGKMDESLQERMTPIYIDYDDRVEEKILKDYPEWYKFFVNFRSACLKYSSSIGQVSAQGITTTRDAAAIRKYIEHNSKTIDQVIAERFIQIKDSEYRKALGKAIAEIYGLDYSQTKNPMFNKTLADADSKILAKKFVYTCRTGVK